MATIDDVLGFWFRPGPATGAAEYAAKIKRWYAGGEAEDAAIRARFGRFPHRNVALGRTPTPEEIEFLKTWDARARPKTFASLFGPRR